MQSADVELLRSLVGDGPTDAALVELLARCDGDLSVAANRWFEASASEAPLAAPPPVSSSATEWPRLLGQLEMLAFSVVQQHELDGPLLPGEALELQVGSGRRKAAGASSGKRRALGADEPQPLRFCARGVTVGRVPASAAKRRPKLTRWPGAPYCTHGRRVLTSDLRAVHTRAQGSLPRGRHALYTRTCASAVRTAHRGWLSAARACPLPAAHPPLTPTPTPTLTVGGCGRCWRRARWRCRPPWPTRRRSSSACPPSA